MDLVDIQFREHDKFQDKAGRDLYFVRLLKDTRLFCWYIRKVNNVSATQDIDALGVYPREIELDVLKRLGVWDKFTEDKRKSLEHGELIIRSENNSKMQDKIAKMQEGRRRRSEFSHLPREITCSQCGSTKDISPSVLHKLAGLSTVTGAAEVEKLGTFMKFWSCSECKPRHRGRAANPLYKDIPRKIGCSVCKKPIVVNPKLVYELYNGDKAKILEYCTGYLCRKCNPKTGEHLRGKRDGRGRKPNPLNIGIPKRISCIVCKKEVGIIAGQIRSKADKMGITVEKLLSDYHCKSCGGMVRGKKV